MKKALTVLICMCMLLGFMPVYALAADSSGKIDLYEVFSNKEDRMKTEVGSRIYKWSLHLPDDAIIYKSDRANFFNMSTNSYQSSIQLEVNKNSDEFTLEEMLYKMQNSSRRENYWIWGDKEFFVDITRDTWGQRYIKVIKAESFYDYFMVDKAAEEFRDYIENRIYIENGYIYNLTVNMNGKFYRQHEDMFDKLISSFRLSFDETNPYIKELSDSVSTTREYINTSYGWKIVMSPYWKMDGTPNARHQTFRPVYTDEELDGIENNKEDNEDDLGLSEGITVSLISSAVSNERASQWVEKEMAMLKDNYNSQVYEIIKKEAGNSNGMDAQHVVIRYKTVTKNPYIVHNVYVIGNGYKYLVSATIKEEKYQDTAKRQSYENMLNSFKLEKGCISKYLGKIIAAESILDLNGPKELKTKKYDFTTNVTKSWDIYSNNNDYYMNRYNVKYFYDEGTVYRGDISNYQAVTAFEPSSKMRINMSAGLNANEMDKIITDRVGKYIRNDEISLGLADVKIKSGQYGEVQLYSIVKEYDLNAINNFVNTDANKKYDLERLVNEYEYVIKIGKDLYIQSITLPVANSTVKNKNIINEIWENTSINKVNYSRQNISWNTRSLEEFDKEN